MKRITLSFVALFSVFTFSFAQFELGTVEAVLRDVQSQNARTTSTYSLKLNAQEAVDITLEDYYSKDKELSMTGKAIAFPNSSFFLKCRGTSFYGSLLLHDSKTAYEITTSNGVVSIAQVDPAKINPDLYGEQLAPPAQNGLVMRVAPVYSPMAQRQVIHIGPYNNEDVTKLQSKPGSEYVFYLNNKAVMSGTTPMNGRSKEEMYRVWQCTADQYSMYDLNVTMDLEVYNAAKAKSVLKTGIIDFLNQDGRSNADLSSFGTTQAARLFRDPGNGDYGYGIGMTSAHEIGHQMGMSHDGGGSGGEYFEGLPAVQWGPIMGNYWQGGSWQNQLFTWSKGEYNTASQKQDDLNIMNKGENIPYEVDDIPTSVAMKLGAGGTISPKENWGQIAQNTDSDEFTFSIGSGGGSITIRIDPLEYLRQLDVDAKIVNAQGSTVASSNMSKHRSAEFKSQALPEGSYKLVIQGGAELTPQTGFSKYSSLGYYGMEGTITNAVITSVESIALGNYVSAYPNPTQGEVNIRYASPYSQAHTELTTVTGETVFSSNELVKTIDMSGLTNGIYLLKITIDGESCVKKISKL